MFRRAAAWVATIVALSILVPGAGEAAKQPSLVGRPRYDRTFHIENPMPHEAKDVYRLRRKGDKVEVWRTFTQRGQLMTRKWVGVVSSETEDWTEVALRGSINGAHETRRKARLNGGHSEQISGIEGTIAIIDRRKTPAGASRVGLELDTRRRGTISFGGGERAARLDQSERDFPILVAR